VSTRRLITLALLCGLAILLAGGTWLFLAGRADDDQVVASFLPIGATASVGGVAATLVATRQAPDALVLEVDMSSDGPAAGDPGKGWAVISSRGLVPRAELQDGDTTGSPACAGQDLAAAGSLRCTVTFQPTAEQLASDIVAVFGRGGERASWSLG